MKVKTEISLGSSLFEKVETLASELKVNRSRLVEIAVQEFIGRDETGGMLAALNEVYEDGPDEGDRAIERGSLEYHRQLMRDEPWKRDPVRPPMGNRLIPRPISR